MGVLTPPGVEAARRKLQEDVKALGGDHVATPEPVLYKAAKAILAAAEKYKINPAYLWGVYGTESSFGQNTKGGGPFQFTAATAKEYGYPAGNETGSANFNWTTFTKQAEAAAHLLSVNGLTKDPRTALEKYNSGKAGGDVAYYNKVIARAKSFAIQFGGHEESEKTAEKGNEPASSEGSLWANLEAYGLKIVLLLAGAVLLVYGIMLAVKPGDQKPNPLKLAGAFA